MQIAPLSASGLFILGLFSIGLAAPAAAEVVEETESRFVTKDEAVVSATPKETWLALISPAGWWSSEHTWSADAANLRLTPQAGGCFCEKIPEVVTEDSFTLEGSVEHMRVIQAYPERALRMVGALGPLQSEPVTGVLTIVLTEVETPEGMGTRIVWEYNVGGPMRYEVPAISKAVDAVMSLQLAGLSDKLGLVDMPREEETDEAGAPDEEEAKAEEEPAEEAEPDTARKGPPALIEAEDTLKEAGNADDGDKAEKAGKDAARKAPSVDEAFDDLVDPSEDPPLAQR